MAVMGVASRRRALADVALLVGAFALLATVSVGLFAQVRSAGQWFVLLSLAAAVTLVARAVLRRLFAPLQDLSAWLERSRRAHQPLVAAAARFSPFVKLASLAIELSAREQHARAALSAVGLAAGGDRVAFLRAMSHELRTPLNAIVGFTDVLANELDGPITADQRESLGIVRASAATLAGIVADMIDVAQLAASDGTRPRTELDVAELVEGVRDAVEERRGMRPVYVRVSVDKNAARMIAEREGLSRALRVLTEHAIAATDSGEVALLCEREGREHVFRVQGDGLLLQPGARSLLTGDAASAASAASAVPGPRATLLRLAIARELILHQGGRIEIVSAPPSLDGIAADAGAAIVVRLPSEVPP